MKNIILAIMVMLGFSCSSNGQNSEFENMDVNQFANYITNDSVQTLDVRTPDEYSEGHIKGAVNINVYDNDFLDEATKELDKSRPVAVYCRSGKRSADAAQKLSAAGYKVTNLEGGILAWQNSGKPVVK